MSQTDTSKVIQKNVKLLSSHSVPEYEYIPRHEKPLPVVYKLKEIVELIRAIIFPGFLGDSITKTQNLEYHIGVNIERLHILLTEQIKSGICFSDQIKCNDSGTLSSQLALVFIDRIPEIKRLVSTDVKATFDADPAAQNHGEVIFCYPTIKAMLNHRIAHELLKLGVPLLPRIISELAHSETGIDIHPGAQIGEYFSIDHGTGVVIGETTVIGNHVLLYQGVTLGAKKFTYDENGHPLNIPRHPIIEDNVVIYANANVLGQITIGKGSVIGGNVWITSDVPPNSKIVQQKAVDGSFAFGSGI
jgi:serine O-acetyltransferase